MRGEIYQKMLYMAYLYKSTMVNSRVDTGKSDCPEMSPQKGWETYGKTKGADD